MSTISISLLDIIGQAVACEVVFKPVSTPEVKTPNLIISGSRSVFTGSDGTAEIVLEPGMYGVQFQGIRGNYDLVSIVVPDDALTYELVGLISSGVSPQLQPLFNLMGFAINVQGDLVPDDGLIPGGYFELNTGGDLVPA